MKIKFMMAKLKMKFETATCVAGTIRILKVDEHTNCVEFQKTTGSLASFSDLYKEIAKRLDMHNDSTF